MTKKVQEIKMNLITNMKFPTVACLLMLFMTPLISHGQNSPGSIINKFFNNYKNNNVNDAINFLFSTNKNSSDLKEGIEKVKIGLSASSTALGKFYDYELLSKNSAGKDLILFTFLVKHERDALTFRILFYKPADEWRVQTFKFDNNITEELEGMSKSFTSQSTSVHQ